MKVSILLTTVLLFAGLEGIIAARLVPGSGSNYPTATAAVKIDKETKFDQPSSSHADHERNQPPVYYPSSSAAEPLHYSETEASYDKENLDNCKAYYETELRQKCVHFTDQVCSTTHKEFCKDVKRKSCQAVTMTGDSVRRCVNVTELHCGLVETVQYEMVTASYTVQKCHMVTERVCDTVYEVQTDEDIQEDVQCVQVPSYSCRHQERTVYDRVCRHQTKHHDCIGGHEDQSECQSQTEVTCHDTPKVVKVLVCSDGEEQVCKKLVAKIPSAVEKQSCHDEEKKVCQMEERKQPKQVKRYLYKKECKQVPRQVCANVDAQHLVPECDDVTTRRTCDYVPVDSCQQVPQSHCFTVPQKVLKYDCQKNHNHHPEPSQTNQY